MSGCLVKLLPARKEGAVRAALNDECTLPEIRKMLPPEIESLTRLLTEAVPRSDGGTVAAVMNFIASKPDLNTISAKFQERAGSALLPRVRNVFDRSSFDPNSSNHLETILLVNQLGYGSRGSDAQLREAAIERAARIEQQQRQINPGLFDNLRSLPMLSLPALSGVDLHSLFPNQR